MKETKEIEKSETLLLDAQGHLVETKRERRRKSLWHGLYKWVLLGIVVQVGLGFIDHLLHTPRAIDWIIRIVVIFVIYYFQSRVLSPEPIKMDFEGYVLFKKYDIIRADMTTYLIVCSVDPYDHSKVKLWPLPYGLSRFRTKMIYWRIRLFIWLKIIR